MPIAVLGAGISGLTAAHALMRHGHDVQILDRRATAGGRIHTERRDGFLVEHGPNSMISPAPGAESLIETLGLSPERIDKTDAVRHRYLVRDGSIHALPLDPLGFFSSNFFSLRGRLRMLAEPFVPPRPGDETVADFIRRRFGRELLDYVFDPLVGGLYAGDPEHLSVAALLPRLKQLEARYGSVMRGAATKMLSGMDARFDPRRRQLFSFREGMATLPQRLAAALGPRLSSGIRVEALLPSAGGGFRLKVCEQGPITTLRATLRARNVVIALPAYAAARLLESFSPDAAHALSNIAHPPLAIVALGFHRRQVAHPLDGLGVLTPTIERRNVLGFLFSSTLFSGRAPDDHVLLTAYVGGARQPELAQLAREELIALVRAEARDLLGAQGEPVFESVRYWRHGLPQPGLGHAAQIGVLREIEQAFPGLNITGNYIAGISTAACIDAALDATHSILRDALQNTRPKDKQRCIVGHVHR
ncbi:MAG: protoporphyrinogen oxidase [Rhodocyclaceae bacterium]|nr:protoporphyrinogen oxidase [Rhodocyclaceae bacterium]